MVDRLETAGVTFARASKLNLPLTRACSVRTTTHLYLRALLAPFPGYAGMTAPVIVLYPLLYRWFLLIRVGPVPCCDRQVVRKAGQVSHPHRGGSQRPQQTVAPPPPPVFCTIMSLARGSGVPVWPLLPCQLFFLSQSVPRAPARGLLIHGPGRAWTRQGTYLRHRQGERLVHPNSLFK